MLALCRSVSSCSPLTGCCSFVATQQTDYVFTLWTIQALASFAILVFFLLQLCNVGHLNFRKMYIFLKFRCPTLHSCSRKNTRIAKLARAWMVHRVKT